MQTCSAVVDKAKPCFHYAEGLRGLAEIKPPSKLKFFHFKANAIPDAPTVLAATKPLAVFWATRPGLKLGQKVKIIGRPCSGRCPSLVVPPEPSAGANERAVH